MLTLRSASVDFWERNAPYARESDGADPVSRSWRRAAALGVRPDGNAPPEGVDRHTLLTLRAQLDEVCTIGARLLDPMASELARKNIVALLTDANGTILLARGGGAFGRTAARSRLVEGARWGEDVRGTNAIGTAIAERCPVSVVGSAHYERVNHALFCCAVPIFCPQGNVVAVIDVTGRMEDEDPFAELAVTSFAYRLEHALRLHASAEAATVRASSGPRAVARAVGVDQHEADPFARLAGTDPTLRDAIALARRVAKSDLPVLLLAESGSGKELMARAVHDASERRAAPFVAINCGAVAPTLLESELFGFAAGAFTGARAGGYAGKVGAAKGGTLFLDEVAEMPAPLQAALLRVLDDGAYYPVGDNRMRSADVRLICATCRDLPAMVLAGAFRSDLYYRIKGATVSLPPLRTRADRVALADALLLALASELRLPAPALSLEAVAIIDRAPWRGNVRELKTAMHYALVLADGEPVITPAHLPPDVLASAADLIAGGERQDPLGAASMSRRQAERAVLEDALARGAGNLSEAARSMGVARTTLYRLMRRHGLP